MIMPDKIDEKMLAPCGMNCMVCSRHCYHKNPCPGCFSLGASVTGRAFTAPIQEKNCDIRHCAQERALSELFPSELSEKAALSLCGLFRLSLRSLSEALEKRFRIRYDIDLSANNEEIRCAGAAEFLRMQKEEFTCPVCKGVISIQDEERIASARWRNDQPRGSIENGRISEKTDTKKARKAEIRVITSHKKYKKAKEEIPAPVSGHREISSLRSQL